MPPRPGRAVTCHGHGQGGTWWHAQSEVMGVVFRGVLRLPSAVRATAFREQPLKVHHALRLELRDVPLGPGRYVHGHGQGGIGWQGGTLRTK